MLLLLMLNPLTGDVGQLPDESNDDALAKVFNVAPPMHEVDCRWKWISFHGPTHNVTEHF